MKKTLDFIQIYYKEDQKKELYDFASPYFNVSVTPYFENSVIAEVVPQSRADLISVASWRLRKKRMSISSHASLQFTGGAALTRERILEKEFDVAVLTPRPSGHKMLFMARHWHGQVWEDAFTTLTSFLLRELSIEIPAELTHPVYGNHFVARREVYHNYVESCLSPTISFMERTGSVFNQDAGYRIVKERLGELDSPAYCEKGTSNTEWAIGVFLLERLFSIWINDKNLKIINC